MFDEFIGKNVAIVTRDLRLTGTVLDADETSMKLSLTRLHMEKHSGEVAVVNKKYIQVIHEII